MIEFGASIALVWGFLVASALSLYLVFLSILVKARARDYYRRHEKDFLETVVSLTEGGVAVKNERFDGKLPWEVVVLVADTPRGLLFCGRGRRPLCWLPTRVFSEDVTCQEVRNLLETVGVAVRRVS